MNIRNAKREDLEAVFCHSKTMATSFQVEFEPFCRSFMHHVENNSSCILVAEVDGKVVGYCLGYDHYAFYANGLISWLEEIYVLEEYRKLKIGRNLMESFEAWALERESKLVSLATRRASSFYNAIGYEESAIYFRKVLEPNLTNA